MKPNSLTWSVIVAIGLILTAALWFVSAGYASAQAGAVAAAAATSADGILGAVKQSDNSLISPLGNAAGGVVDVKNMTVAEVVAALEGSTQFQSLFSQAGGKTTVSGSGSFSVFVPTDGAFSQLPSGTLSGMSSSERSRLAKYHIVKQAIDTDASVAGSMQTLSGDYLNFNFSSNKIEMVGSAIVITQFNCKNGVVYTIDNVLLPPKK